MFSLADPLFQDRRRLRFIVVDQLLKQLLRVLALSGQDVAQDVVAFGRLRQKARRTVLREIVDNVGEVADGGRAVRQERDRRLLFWFGRQQRLGGGPHPQ